MTRVITSVIVMVLCTHVMGEPYEVTYYPPDSPYMEGQELPGPFPEDQGWERYMTGGGADRVAADGVFGLYAYELGISDNYLMDLQGQLDAGPGETFYVEWRMRLLPGSADADVGVYISRDYDAGDIDLGFSTDHITSYFDYNRVDLDTTQWHTYRIESLNMIDYDFLVDGEHMYTGFFDWPGVTSSWVLFGDGGAGSMSSSEWSYIRFGAVRIGDLNGDGAIGLADFVIFAGCFTGAGATTAPLGCADTEFRAADLDLDRDVDLTDFIMFASLFGT